SGEKATARTMKYLVGATLSWSFPLLTSHSFKDPSPGLHNEPIPTASNRESGENATVSTTLASLNARRGAPLFASQTRASPCDPAGPTSPAPLATNDPSGDKATEDTGFISPATARISCPSRALSQCTCLPLLPTTTVFPS